MTHTSEPEEKRICCNCVGESYLSNEIEQSGKAAVCSYCGDTAETIPVEELADRIETAFDDHYTRTSDQPDSWQQTLMSDRESHYDWQRDGEPVLDAIENAAGIPQEAATDALDILDQRHYDFDAAKMGEESEFSSEAYYEEKGTSTQAWQEEWRTFEKSLKTEARFFSRTAAAHLASIFGDIDKLKRKDGRPLVINAGPKRGIAHLYRARVFQSEPKLKEALCRPDLHIGSPPPNLANAGRMNARGISVFYGATNASVAIAEVRPPVGSSVAVARFNIIRPLRLLDLTALENVQDGGSIFDPSLKRRLERVAFLGSLGQRITRPVMPDDAAFDYLATQAIADFLATENEPRLDGIIFRSAQSKQGRNVVLFHKAARVEELRFPEGTAIEAYTGHGSEDGWEVDYSVTERVPKPPKPSPPKDDDDILSFLPYTGPPHPYPGPLYRHDDDDRDATLRVDPASAEVHQVEWVRVNCTTYKVHRHRFENHDMNF